MPTRQGVSRDKETRLTQAPLCVKCATAFGAEDRLEEVCADATKLCTRAIGTLLAVVADTSASAPEEEEEVGVDVDSEGHCGTPLNVNQGAIGANASFAAVREDDEEERARRTAVQRLVVSVE